MATAKKKTAPKAAKKPSNPKPKPGGKLVQETAQKETPTSKKAQIHALLERPEGATIEEMAKLTEWQNHTVRGFLSMLKKAGKTVTSKRIGEVRSYFIKKP